MSTHPQEAMPLGDQRLAPLGGLAVTRYDEMLQRALDGKADMGVVKEIIALAQDAKREFARTEFFRELAEFQAEHRIISTNQSKQIVGRQGGGFAINYADLPHLVEQTQGPLARRGFSFSWDTEVEPTGRTLTSIFVLRHILGHEERNRFQCPTESNSGSSPQQKYGAADSYAKRRAMIAGLGIVTREDSGQHVKESDTTPIDEEQVATLKALREETKAPAPKFLAHFGIARLEELPAARYAEAVALLEDFRRKGAA